MPDAPPPGPRPFVEVAPGVLQWSVWHAERALDFNGLLVLDPAGNVVVDPPELDSGHWDEIWTRGGVAHVVLTNRHHVRRTAEVVARTGARVHAPARDADGLDVGVDATFRDGDELPAGLRAVAVPHSKTPGETALLLPRDGGTLILGDALIGGAGGALTLLPAEKLPNPATAARGLRVLLEHAWSRVLVGDGSNPPGGRRAVEDFLVHHGVAPKRRRA
jgi:hypothetical protein